MNNHVRCHFGVLSQENPPSLPHEAGDTVLFLGGRGSPLTSSSKLRPASPGDGSEPSARSPVTAAAERQDEDDDFFDDPGFFPVQSVGPFWQVWEVGFSDPRSWWEVTIHP